MKKCILLVFVSSSALCASIQDAIAKQILYAGVSNGQNGQLERYDTSGASLGGYPIPTPTSMAIDKYGNAYIPNFFSPEVVRFDSTGAPLGVFATATSNPGESVIASSLAIDANGRLYVGVNYINDRVERFDSVGTSLGVFATTANVGAPLGLAFDHSGNLYVSGSNYNQIQRFDPNGVFLGTFATGYFTYSSNIALDSQGNLYVVGITGDASPAAIDVFDSSGVYLRSIAGGLREIFCLAIDHNDNVYVGGPNEIRKFRADGSFLGVFAIAPTPPPQFRYDFNTLVFADVVPEPSAALLALAAVATLIFPNSKRTLYR